MRRGQRWEAEFENKSEVNNVGEVSLCHSHCPSESPPLLKTFCEDMKVGTLGN